ncbi:MAG: hypothetical protein QOH68_2541 [Nocardioidaceae bacterium]|nr:hypothetical protein [Nocardioidaceae bacterium]
MRTLVATLICAALVTGCGGSEPPRPGTPAEFAAGWDELAAIADRPAVELRASDRPAPPKGFSDADIDVLAEDAVSVLRRSISPEVEVMTPADAIAYVTADLVPATVKEWTTRVEADSAGQDWEWQAASLFQTPSREPARIIRVAWAAETQPGTLADGTPHDQLVLRLQAFVVHTRGTRSHPKTIIIRRTVRMAAYDPDRGREFFPGVDVLTSPWGNRGCALLSSSTLYPADDIAELNRDVLAARRAIDASGAQDTFPATPEELLDIAKRCVQHPD